MTRFSTTFLVSILAASFFTASAAPLQLHTRFGARAEGEAAAADSGADAQSAAANSNIVVTLLTAGIAVLDQAKIADQELATEVDTVKAFMQAAAIIESAGLANASATAIAEGGDNGGQDNGSKGNDNSATANAQDPKARRPLQVSNSLLKCQCAVQAAVASVISSAQAAQKTQDSNAAKKNSKRQFGRSRG
ncbi:hypothetical protein B0H19DRAFT_1324501 [Mycena capillaripes]|nr:hypothetical protein B0H19DRAFT_1324501 [Mycena capillaripes]